MERLRLEELLVALSLAFTGKHGHLLGERVDKKIREDCLVTHPVRRADCRSVERGSTPLRGAAEVV